MKIDQKSLETMRLLARSFDNETLADRLNKIAVRPRDWTNEEKAAFLGEAARRLNMK